MQSPPLWLQYAWVKFVGILREEEDEVNGDNNGQRKLHIIECKIIEGEESKSSKRITGKDW